MTVAELCMDGVCISYSDDVSLQEVYKGIFGCCSAAAGSCEQEM